MEKYGGYTPDTGGNLYRLVNGQRYRPLDLYDGHLIVPSTHLLAERARRREMIAESKGRLQFNSGQRNLQKHYGSDKGYEPNF